MVRNDIRALTIDRKFLYDGQYLAHYYKAIEKYSPYLALMRCLEKLDNMFAFKLIGEFMQQLIAFLQTTGCVPQLAEKYESFKQEMIKS